MAPGPRSLILALAGAALPRLGWAHGRLTLPVPRVGAGIYQDTPVTSETSDDFVCRLPSKNRQIRPPTVVAGGTFDLRWDFGAAHVGDCAVFISYDVSADRSRQRFVKIANLPDCKSQTGQMVTIDIPQGLPRGEAILRWDWRALHIFPTVEWYAQCADVFIDSAVEGSIPASRSFSITQPPIYPSSGAVGKGFRDPWGNGALPGQSGYYVTGPACFDETLTQRNHCDETAPGTPGFTGQPSESGAGGQTTSGSDSSGGGSSDVTSEVSGGSSSDVTSEVSGDGAGEDESTGSGYGSGSGYGGGEDSASSGSASEAASSSSTCVPTFDCKAVGGWCSQRAFEAYCRGLRTTACSGVCKLAESDVQETSGGAAAAGASGSGATGGSAEPCPNKLHGRCGGRGWRGSRCCPEGTTCTRFSKWHSQCQAGRPARRSTRSGLLQAPQPSTHDSRTVAAKPHGHLRTDSKNVRGTAMLHLGSTLERRPVADGDSEAAEAPEPWPPAGPVSAALRDEM